MTTGIISDALENAWLNHVLRNTAYTSPGTAVYAALFTSNPADNFSGTECTGDGYARVQLQGTAEWNAPGTTRATANTNAVTFPTATGDWGTITHLAICHGATGGTLLYYCELTASKIISSGDTFSIAAGEIDISIGGACGNYLAGKLIDHTLRNTAYTTPGTAIYVSLHQADPTSAGDGTECSGTGYEREQCTGWDAASGGATQNTGAIDFGTCTATWGTVVGVGVWDALSAGNYLMGGTVSANKVTAAGDTFQIAAGALDVTLG